MSKLIIEKRYGQTPNSILTNPKISLKTKGMFGYLQSKPDNWNFAVSRIQKEMKDGKSAISEALKELEENGFLRRKPRKNTLGKWDGYDYILSENPFPENPSTEKPSTEKPLTENWVTLSNKDNTKKDINKKEEIARELKPRATSNIKKPTEDRPMNEAEFIEWCRKSKQKHIRFIGEWADTTHPRLTSYYQWQSYIKRNVRAAKLAEPFSEDQIAEALSEIDQAIKDKWLTNFTIETLFKFLTKDNYV